MRGHGKKVQVRRKTSDQSLDKTFPPVEAEDEPLQEMQQLDGNDGIGPSGIVWLNVKRKVSDLRGWPRNPRRITESQAKHLATSIIKYGYVEPMAVNSDNTIIGGHMREMIMLQANLITGDTLLDVRIPSRPLSEEEVAELNVRLNKNTGTWDFDILTESFDQTNLREWGFSPMDFGMISQDMKPVDEVKKMEPSDLKPTGLKPSKPRICTHCEQQCHCVVEER